MYELDTRNDPPIRLKRDLSREEVERTIGPPELELVPRPSWEERVLWAYPRRGLYLYFNGDRLAAWRTYPEGYHRRWARGR